jgi:tetratricopeptide (TPR) repeat protein
MAWAVFAISATATPQVPGPKPHDYDFALDALYNLDFSTAEQTFESLTHQDPANPAYWNGIASTLWLRILYQQQKMNVESFSGRSLGTKDSKDTVDPVDERKLRATIDVAITKAKARLAADPNDVQALYSLGVSNATLASFAATAKRAYLEAANRTKDARNYHRRVLALDPNFTDALLSVGAYEYVVTVIPWPLRYSILLPLGLTGGDKEGGIRKLETVAARGKHAATDARMLLIVIYEREKKYDQALRLTNELMAQYPRNFLFEMSEASIYGKMGNWNQAVAVYEQVAAKVQKKQNGYERLREGPVYFQIGMSNVNRLNLEEAIRAFSRVISSDESTTNEKADSHIWLGRIFDSRHERDKAVKEYSAVLTLDCDSDYKDAAQAYLKKPHSGY